MADREKIMDTYNRIDIEWGFVWGSPSTIVDRVVLELEVSRDEVINVVVEEWFYKKANKMIDRKKIISTFERIEEQDGELWNYNASTTLDKTAEELKLPRDQVKDILISHWTKQGAG